MLKFPEISKSGDGDFFPGMWFLNNMLPVNMLTNIYIYLIYFQFMIWVCSRLPRNTCVLRGLGREPNAPNIADLRNFEKCAARQTVPRPDRPHNLDYQLLEILEIILSRPNEIFFGNLELIKLPIRNSWYEVVQKSSHFINQNWILKNGSKNFRRFSIVKVFKITFKIIFNFEKSLKNSFFGAVHRLLFWEGWWR